MNFINSLVPTIEHLGMFGYWLVLLAAFAESLAFVGALIPGGILVLLAGLLSAQGYLDLGDLFWFATVGAVLGDGASYWLGTKGSSLFRKENRVFKLSHLEKGERFFTKHGNKSVFFGRFVAPLRPIVPFVAGLFNMNPWAFLMWNVASALAWAAVYLLVGYFFGGAINIIELWSTRAGFFALVAVAALAMVWFLLKKSGAIFSFARSMMKSLTDALLSNPYVQRFMQRHPHLIAFIRRRLNTEKFFGLPLTFFFFAFVYVLTLFVGIAEDIIVSDPVVAMDARVANLFFAFRDAELVTFFTWVTTLGTWQVVCSGVLAASLLFFLWHKRAWIVPLWMTVIGSESFTFLGKLAFHRPRPDVAAYVENGFSFPSGHATIAVALYGFLTYVLSRETKSWGRKINIIFFGLLIVIGIGFSRLYLDVHFVSDVWAGYLSGLLWLIIGIALLEWLRSRRKALTPPSASRSVRVTTGIVLLAQLALFAAVALRTQPVRTVPARGTSIIAEDVLTSFADQSFPSFTETLLGNAQEPISVMIIARDDAQFTEAMNRAGWRTADRSTPRTVLNLAASAARNQGYTAAPMTPSFWNAVVHDYGFEKPTETQSVRERHHARFWITPLETTDGSHVYVGTVSLDTGLKWLITHKISPDIDAERELLFSDLQNAQAVAAGSKSSFVPATLGQNFTGDAFFTDGKVYVMTLK